MKTKLLIFTMILSVFFIWVRSEEKNPGELPEKYKKWIEEEVVYIITPSEKDVFLQLETDRERDLFIEAFWKHRDQILGTPENEYKNEHYRRINHANFTFGRTVAKPGWRTDQGRVYIILGEPRQVERFVGEIEIYNSEIWSYSGLAKYGLPPLFNLVFFQKQGSGEYVLYSPTSDGPQALMTRYWGDSADYYSAYRELINHAPTLAKVSLSLIPGEESPYYTGRPSLASETLLQNIYGKPHKEVKDRYAEKFLHFKDIIEVEYSANYIDNESSIKVLKSPSGTYFVHYVVELMSFSVQQIAGAYSTYISLNGNVSDLDGKTIYQYERSFSFKVDEEQLKNINYKPFDLYDMFPLLPGEYKLSIILKNEVSKEFTSLEENIVIPEDDSLLRMGPLILSYKMDHVPSESRSLKPFRIENNLIYSQPNKVFHSQEKLFLFFQILGLTPDLEQNAQLKFEFIKGGKPFFELTKAVNEYQDKINFTEEFSLQEFSPDYYQVQISLLKGDQVLHQMKESFEITPRSGVPRPWVHSRTLPPLDDPQYSSILGKQSYNKGEINKARIYLEDAYHKRPNSRDLATNLAKVYYNLGEYEKIIEILSIFSDSTPPNYEFHLLLGKSHQALGDYAKAVDIYDRAISHFGFDANLLNSLGECYFRLGSAAEALAAWEKSLEVNPDQPEIKKIIRDIKK
jgi:GWxTD domain-containing protein